MEEIKISELQKIDDFIAKSRTHIYLEDILMAIDELSYELNRDVTADEIIEYLKR